MQNMEKKHTPAIVPVSLWFKLSNHIDAYCRANGKCSLKLYLTTTASLPHDTVQGKAHAAADSEVYI